MIPRTGRPVWRPYLTVTLAVLLLVACLVGSLLYDRMEKYQVFSTLVPGHWREIPAFFLVFFGGSIFGMICTIITTVGIRETTTSLWTPLREVALLGVCAACAALAACIWWTSAWMSPDNEHKWLRLAQHDPGGLYAAFIGILTVVGLVMTIIPLREMARRVYTFPQLMVRLTKMLREKGSDTVRFMSYTPALGYMAVDDAHFRRFYEALRRNTGPDSHSVHMTCLNKTGLSDWHDLFIGRPTRRRRFARLQGESYRPSNPITTPGLVDSSLAKAATDVGEQILESVEHEARFRHLRDEQANESSDEPLDAPVKRLPFEFLPGYYFFVSSKTAIIVAPLQLPFPKGAPKEAQVQLSSRTVQMIGWETNDETVINELQSLYSTYEHLPSTYVAETRDIVTAADLKQWLEPHDAVGLTGGKYPSSTSAIREVTRQFEVASTGRTIKTAEDDQLRTDYKPHFIDMTKTRLEVTIRVALTQEYRSEPAQPNQQGT